MTFGAPAQHPTCKISDVGKPGLAQDHRSLRRTATGAAHRDDRTVVRQLLSAFGQLAQWNKPCAANVSERAVELARLANIENLHALGMLFEAVGIDPPIAGESRGGAG
jgi:hypothetical protein